MHAFIIGLALLLALPWSGVLAATVSHQENSSVSIVSEQASLSRGAADTFRVGILIEPRPGWHIYWENPGDSGLAPTLTWSLPEGFTAQSIDWPPPHKINEGTLATYAYDKPTLLPVSIQPPASLTENTVKVSVHVDLLVCHDICVPESADVDIEIPVSEKATSDTANAKLFRVHDRIRAIPLTPPSTYTFAEQAIQLSIPDGILSRPATDNPRIALEDVASVEFFIREPNIVQYAAESTLSRSENKLILSLPSTPDGQMPPRISGILKVVLKDGDSLAFQQTFDHAAASEAPGTTEDILFPAALMLAVLGGLVLNLMPCVLPVLSLKALALAKKAGSEHSLVVRQGVAYTAGILVSFAAISGTLLILREGGESVGWGYQMQSPAFVISLTILLFLVGLSLSGYFHLPVLLGNVGGKWASETSARGSFFTGILATAVATPCTAPFMAPAVGAALTMPHWQAFLIFQALGLGLALPFLLISLFPSLRTFLPKPGAWMETFKQAMAFPMYASVIWLLWVLTLQTGVEGMVLTLSVLLFFVFILWLRSIFPAESSLYRVIAAGLSILVLGLTLTSISGFEAATPMPALPDEASIETVSFSKSSLDSLRSQGKAVFVDATAAWCITCQVNARVALHTPRVMKKFKEHGITLMIADWTRRNQEITEFLASFGFNGVPLNVYYPPGAGKPVVLPQLLSEDIVIQTIHQNGE